MHVFRTINSSQSGIVNWFMYSHLKGKRVSILLLIKTPVHIRYESLNTNYVAIFYPFDKPIFLNTLIYIFIVSIFSRIRISCYASTGLFTTIGPILSPVSWLCFLCAPSQSGNLELFQHLQNAIIFLSPLKTSDNSITSLTSLSSLFMHWLMWVCLDILYKNGQLWEYHPLNAIINIFILRCNKGCAFLNFFSFIQVCSALKGDWNLTADAL